MIEAWSPQDVYAAEAALEDELASGELMARAVEGLAEVVAARVAQLSAETVVALVGAGNNGADALYAVAHLALGVNGPALLAVVVTSALPTAQNIFVHATRYDRGTVLARDTILLTTVGAVPVILLIAALLG